MIKDRKRSGASLSCDVLKHLPSAFLMNSPQDDEEDGDLIPPSSSSSPQPRFVSAAYETVSSMSLGGRAAVCGAALLLIMMIINILSTDYTTQTKLALYSSGASQSAIQTILPPTLSEQQAAQYQKQALLGQLASNMTMVTKEISDLRVELSQIRSDIASLKKTPPHLRGRS